MRLVTGARVATAERLLRIANTEVVLVCDNRLDALRDQTTLLFTTATLIYYDSKPELRISADCFVTTLKHEAEGREHVRVIDVVEQRRF